MHHATLHSSPRVLVTSVTSDRPSYLSKIKKNKPKSSKIKYREVGIGEKGVPDMFSKRSHMFEWSLGKTPLPHDLRIRRGDAKVLRGSGNKLSTWQGETDIKEKKTCA